jgi:hypothetical protein
MIINRTQILVMGYDDFVRAVEDADTAAGELNGETDGESRGCHAGSGFPRTATIRWPMNRVIAKPGRSSSTAARHIRPSHTGRGLVDGHGQTIARRMETDWAQAVRAQPHMQERGIGLLVAGPGCRHLLQAPRKPPPGRGMADKSPPNSVARRTYGRNAREERSAPALLPEFRAE